MKPMPGKIPRAAPPPDAGSGGVTASDPTGGSIFQSVQSLGPAARKGQGCDRDPRRRAHREDPNGELIWSGVSAPLLTEEKGSPPLVRRTCMALQRKRKESLSCRPAECQSFCSCAPKIPSVQPTAMYARNSAGLTRNARASASNRLSFGSCWAADRSVPVGPRAASPADS